MASASAPSTSTQDAITSSTATTATALTAAAPGLLPLEVQLPKLVLTARMGNYENFIDAFDHTEPFDINMLDADGWSLLHLAIKAHDCERASLEDPNFKPDSFKIVEFLIKKGADIAITTKKENYTSLHIAFRFLGEANFDQATQRTIISDDTRIKILKLILELSLMNEKVLTAVTSKGKTAIDYAKHFGYIDCKIFHNVHGFVTMLSWAVEKNSLILVKLLLEAGANPNVGGEDGYFPIHDARDNLEILRLLVSHRANVDQESFSEMETPLYLALLTNTLEGLACAKFLIENNADVNKANYLGITALYFAATMGDVKLVEMLLAHGANVFATIKSTSTKPIDSLLQSTYPIENKDAIFQLLNERMTKMTTVYAAHAGTEVGVEQPLPELAIKDLSSILMSSPKP